MDSPAIQQSGDAGTRFDPSTQVPDEYDVLCEGCGYSLIGIQSDRCPECGKVFEPQDLPFARVPWLHRRKIGTIKAYRSTLWIILRRPQQFAEELCRPVRISAADAKLFRRLTIRLATLATVMIAIALALIPMIDLGRNAFRWQMHPDVMIWGSCLGVILTVTSIWLITVTFGLLTDLPLFIWKGHPSLRPTELAPIQSYAAAPLAILLLAVPACLVAVPTVVFVAHGDLRIYVLSYGAALIPILATAVGLLSTTTRLMRGAGVASRQVTLMKIYLPLHWLMMLFVGFFGGMLVLTIETMLMQAIGRLLKVA